MTERSVDKKTEALKLAQEAIDDRASLTRWKKARDAIREALAEQCVCGEFDTPGTHRTDGPCLAEQPAQQEPVAWGIFHFGGKRDRKLYTTCDTREQAIAYIADRHQSDDTNTFRAAPIYTSPPNVPTARASKPLTDEQRNWVVATCPTPRHIIDTVEKMHGIKGDA